MDNSTNVSRWGWEVGKALIVSGVVSGVAIFGVTTAMERDIAHLSKSVETLATQMRGFREDLKDVYALRGELSSLRNSESFIHQRLKQIEDRQKNLSSRIRDMERLFPRSREH